MKTEIFEILSKNKSGAYAKEKNFALRFKDAYADIKTEQHITDNLLRQRGFDQLFNTNYGKGTSNEELMLEHDFLPIYDCGQITFIYKKK